MGPGLIVGKDGAKVNIISPSIIVVKERSGATINNYVKTASVKMATGHLIF